MAELAAKDTRRRTRKIVPPVDCKALENAALNYLKRGVATRAQVRRILQRRVARSVREHPLNGANGADRAQLDAWVEVVLDRLVALNVVNDATYAQIKAQSLRQSGRSTRTIAQKLREKGVAQDSIAHELRQANEALSELDAAKICARKRRLGPFRRDPSTRATHRQRDLAVLARAGYAFAVARLVIDADLP